MKTRLLLIGAQDCRWYVQQGGGWRLLDTVPMSTGELPVLPAGPVLVVLDLPAEECIVVSMPVLKSGERSRWLRGQLQQHFPGWVCAHGAMGLAPQAMLHGLAATETTAAMAAAFARQHQAYIKGICFQSSLLAGSCARDTDSRLIVAPGLSGGIRHVLAAKGQVLFTRLCQDEYQLLADLVMTCRHLDEAGLFPARVRLSVDPDTGLDEAAARESLAQQWPAVQIESAGLSVAAHPGQLAPSVLLRHRTWLNGPLLARENRRQLDRRGYCAALVLVVLACGYSALLLYLSRQMDTQIGRPLMGNTQTASFAALDHAALQLLDGRGKSVSRMVADLQRISLGMAQLEPARVVAITWQNATPDDIVLTVLHGPDQDEATALATIHKAVPAMTFERQLPASTTDAHWQWLAHPEAQP